MSTHVRSSIYAVLPVPELGKCSINRIMLYIFLHTLFPSFDHIRLQYSSYVFTCRVEKSVDLDQLASQKSADLNLHCFANRICPSLAW